MLGPNTMRRPKPYFFILDDSRINGMYLFRIYVDSKVIGEITLSSGNIGNFSVSLKHRRKGYGTKLLKYTVDFARNKGLGGVYLRCLRSKVAFYEKRGFSIYGYNAKEGVYTMGIQFK